MQSLSQSRHAQLHPTIVQKLELLPLIKPQRPCHFQFCQVYIYQHNHFLTLLHLYKIPQVLFLDLDNFSYNLLPTNWLSMVTLESHLPKATLASDQFLTPCINKAF